MKYEYHRIANYWPLMTESKIAELAEDIKRQGLINPVLLYENKILDGRNRYLACEIAGIEPKFKNYEGNTPVAHAVSLNGQRRDLTESQRAAIAVEILPELEAEAKKRQATSTGGAYPQLVEKLPQAEKKAKSRDQAAAAFDVSGRYVGSAKALKKKAPEVFERIKEGKVTIAEAEKEIRTQEIKTERKKLADRAAVLPRDEKWLVEVGDIRTYKTDKKFDFIITDPPYPKEFLPLYETLAKRTSDFLKPEGLLIVMCGQSYLDGIYSMLSKHLDYYWTACYLTPGQPTPLRTRQVNTTWKPLLIFTNKGCKYKGKIFGDVFKSDGNDKDFHKWGQSVSGMISIISQICLPGQSIFDPFCGSGTTGIAAHRNKCLFHGIDIEKENVGISKGRFSEEKT